MGEGLKELALQKKVAGLLFTQRLACIAEGCCNVFVCLLLLTFGFLVPVTAEAGELRRIYNLIGSNGGMTIGTFSSDRLLDNDWKESSLWKFQSTYEFFPIFKPEIGIVVKESLEGFRYNDPLLRLTGISDKLVV